MNSVILVLAISYLLRGRGDLGKTQKKTCYSLGGLPWYVSSIFTHTHMPLDFIIPPGYGVLQPIQVQPPSSSTAARQQPSVTEGVWLNWSTSAKYNQHWKGSIPLSVVSCWQSQLFVNLLKSFDPHSLCQTKCFMESVMHSKCNQLSRLQPTKQYNCPTNGVHLFFF